MHYQSRDTVSYGRANDEVRLCTNISQVDRLDVASMPMDELRFHVQKKPASWSYSVSPPLPTAAATRVVM